MRAIILAGGFGTRLRAVIPDLPKPMAPVGEKPFLALLIDYLIDQGINEIVLSLHYQPHLIQAYFKDTYAGVKIKYVIEEKPLGTGGAIIHAFRTQPALQPTFVLNGDSFVALDYRAMYQQHLKTKANFTLALREVEDCSRYGSVILNQERIAAFVEKSVEGSGLINAGVYLIDPSWMLSLHLPDVFSLEMEFFTSKAAAQQFNAYLSQDYFIDIGLPEDYARALKELPR